MQYIIVRKGPPVNSEKQSPVGSLVLYDQIEVLEVKDIVDKNNNREKWKSTFVM